MRYLLDTMVVSEPAKPSPNPAVIAWLDEQHPLDLAVSALTLGELQRGVARMTDGRRKAALTEWLASEMVAQFEGRVLPVDLEVALAWGELTAVAERMGRALHVVDGLLLATARVHGLTLVTRDVGETGDRGVAVMNPFR